jgi:preprotein translocase subunit SecE
MSVAWVAGVTKMVAKTEEVVSNKADTAKLLVAIAILIAGIYGFYYYEAESLLYRVLGLVVMVGIALFITSVTTQGQRLMGFAKDSRMEVRKVVWPTRQETVQTTLMVVVAVIIIGIFLWLIDMLLAEAIQVLTGTGG